MYENGIYGGSRRFCAQRFFFFSQNAHLATHTFVNEREIDVEESITNDTTKQFSNEHNTKNV